MHPRVLTLLVAALTPACTPARPAPSRAAPASFVNRVWQVDSSPQVARGELRAFLSEGTLVMASDHGAPALGRWRVTGDRRLTITEEGRDYDIEIVELTGDAFHIVIHGPGTPVDIRFRPADITTPHGR